MKYTPAIWDTVDKYKESKPVDRLEIAVEWLDRVIHIFLRYSAVCTNRQLLAHLRDSRKLWHKLVRLEIPFLEDGEEWLLEDEHFEEWIQERFLNNFDPVELPGVAKELINIWEYFGWDSTSLREAAGDSK